MRLLSKDEELFCKKILDAKKNNFFENIIDPYLKDVRVSVQRKAEKVELLWTIQDKEPTSEETRIIIENIDVISIKIITLVNLINMLEKDGYVMLMQKATVLKDDYSFGKGAINLPFITCSFPDPKISELLTEYTKKEIIITEEFKRFCKYNYIARDEQRFQTQFCISITALLVTSFALIINILSNTNNLPKSPDDTKVTSTQIEIIDKNIRMINSTISRYESELVQIETKTLEELKRQNSQTQKTQKKHSTKAK